jgi:hypothetical protein
MSRAGMAALFSAWLVVGCGEAETAQQVALAEGLESPESAFFDAHRQSWYVSNLGGTVPGDGFISRLDARGRIVERLFVAGLDDPKGQRVDGDTLYVADNTRVVAIDLNDPAHVESVNVEGSLFLNDVAIDPKSHEVYVTDTFDNAIYRIANGEATLLLRDVALEAPNGVLFERGSLISGSIGPDLDPATFATSAPGRLFRLDIGSLELTPLTERLGGIDGIERDRGGLLVSETFVGVERIGFDGTVTPLIDNASAGLVSSADIGFDPGRRRIGVPELGGTRVVFFDLEP